MSDYLMALAANEDLRRRNGALYDKLCEVAPEAAEQLTPLTNWESRFCSIRRLVNASCNWEKDPDNQDRIDELFSSASSVATYLPRERAERAKRSAVAKERSNAVSEKMSAS